MKIKVVHICCFFAFLVFFAGVNFGRSVAVAEREITAATDTLTEVREEAKNIRFNEYIKFEAEGRCSGCFTCGGGDGLQYVVMPFETSEPFVEISGIGLLPVKSGTAECIQIYFNDCEVAEKFGNEEVFVRMEG